jgi:hypothetical protein
VSARLVLLAVLAPAGCVGTIEDPMGCDEGMIACDGHCIEELEPELDVVYEEVFRSCNFGACHGVRGPALGLETSSAVAAYEHLVGVPSEQRPELLRVEPFAPERSYLVHKLRGLGMASETEQMPLGAPPLCEARIAAVEAWILSGATN